MGKRARKLPPHPDQNGIVLLIHGIRTQASWVEMAAEVIRTETGAKVQPVRYGYFDTFRFLCPFFTRQAPIDRIIREYRDLRREYPNAPISVIAHSFGTYAVAKALEHEPDIALHRLIFCGSIVPDNFRRARIRSQLGDDEILNDCGTHDIWPVLAKSVTWGYGSTGTFGFGTAGIRDRFSKFTHSAYFNAEFIKKYWTNFLKDGEIVGTEWERERPNPPYWQSLLGWLPLKWLIPGAAALGVWWWAATVEQRLAAIVIDPQIYIGHWTGVSQVLARLHLNNPTNAKQVFWVERATLISPEGSQIPLFVEGIVQCNNMRPLTMNIEVEGRETEACNYSFVGDFSGTKSFNSAINDLAISQNVASMSPDWSRSIVKGETLEALVDFANHNMSWTSGPWQIKIDYYSGLPNVSGQRKASAAGRFTLNNDDIKHFKKAIEFYGSGIGVFFVWRNLSPNDMRPVSVDSPPDNL